MYFFVVTIVDRGIAMEVTYLMLLKTLKLNRLLGTARIEPMTFSSRDVRRGA